MKRIFIFLLFTLCISLETQAQDQVLEQLKSDILSATTEERKIEGLITLGINLGRRNPDSLQFYADSLSSSDFNSPELILAGKNFMQAVDFFSFNELEKAISLFEETTEQLKALDVPNLYYRCRNFLGIAYTRANRLEDALVFFEETLEEIEANEADVTHKRAAHANMINVYRRAQDFASAIYHSEILISLSDEGSMSRSLAFSYMNMGQMLLDLRYYQRALDAFNEIDPDFLTGSMPLVIDKSKARAYQELAKYDSAIFYFEKSLTYEDEAINPDLKKSARVSLIELYTRNQLLDPIEPLIAKTANDLDPTDPIPLYVDFAIAHMNYLITIGKSDEAIAVGTSLEEFLTNKNALVMSQEAFLLLSELYEEKGETEVALNYNKRFTTLEVSRNELRKTDRIQQARARLAELEASIVVNNEKQTTAFYQKLSIQQWILLGILIIACLVIYQFYKKEKSQRTFASDELEELQKEVAQLTKQEPIKEISFLKLKSHAVVQLENILYIRSDGPYVEIFCQDKTKPEIDRNTLKSLSEELPESFIQVHRSFIVNIHYIKSIYANRLELKDGTEIPVSRSFKPKVESALRASA